MLIHSKDFFFKIILKNDEGSINEAIENKLTAYKIFYIPKKNGVRIIHGIKKENRIYGIQESLYKNFILKFPVPICAKGFIKGQSYMSFLEPHKGNKFFLRIDLKDFFTSITEEHIKDTIMRLIKVPNEEDRNYIADIIAQICTLDRVLPQGAITSPGMSNLVFSRLDQRILKYCQAYEIEYTRYADDILFSSKTFDFKSREWFLKMIQHILKSQHFKINYSKKQIAEDEISLNGFVIANEIRLSRKRFIDISLMIRKGHEELITLREQGENDYLQNMNVSALKYRNLEQYPFNSLSQFIQYLSGYRSYLISWIDRHNIETPGQRKIARTITKIEGLILKIDKAEIQKSSAN